MRRVLAFVVLVALVFAGAPARANGRFPASNAVVVAPEHPEIVLARVTFGVLLSRDGGLTWDWICERGVGFSGAEDPTYAVMNDGRFLAGTFAGVRSSEGGCTWGMVPGTDGVLTVDLAVRHATPRGIVAFSSAYDRQGDAGELFFKSRIFASADEGRSFAVVGAPLAPELLGLTIELAESDPNRLYVSASADLGAPTVHTGFVLTSRDRGQTFAKTRIEIDRLERGPYIAAVDSHDANRVYLRVGGAPDLPSRILVSKDGAKTFETVFTSKGPLVGFALAPDGKKVFVGGVVDGLLVASTKDFVFRQTSKIEVQCLTATEKQVWVCSNQKSGFVLATTADDGATFEPKLHLKDIRGPLACSDTCVKEWPKQRRDLGLEDPKPPAPPEPPAPPPPAKRESLGSVLRVAGLVAIVVLALAILRRVRAKRPR